MFAFKMILNHCYTVKANSLFQWIFYIFTPTSEEDMRLTIENLKDSNEFLNTLLDNITSAIFIADQELRIQSFNDSFQSLFYKNEDLILGQLCGNALGCVYTVTYNADCGTTKNCSQCTLRSSLIQTFLKKIPTNRAVLAREFQINGLMIEKCFQYSTRNIFFNNQEMILVIVDDITDAEKQKEALAEKNRHLEELYKQRNELMGIAAHDLRNPLSVINSFSEIMLETFEEHDADRIKELIKIIHNTSSFTLQLLNDILDFSKIESGTLELKKMKLNYISFVKKNLAQNEFFSVQKNIKIHLNTPATNIEFSFDPRRLEQVLNNLLGNAIKYSFPGSEIEVAISTNEEFVITSIRDQGQGIPEKDLPHIFKPFRQVSVKPTQNEKSTGLGLAIVKKIIDFHKGRITVSSKQGAGSTFSFYLPLE